MKQLFGLGGRCCRLSLLLSLIYSSHTAEMLLSTSLGNSGQLSVECVWSWHTRHTLHADKAKDGSVDDKDVESVLVKDDTAALMASTGKDSDRR